MKKTVSKKILQDQDYQDVDINSLDIQHLLKRNAYEKYLNRARKKLSPSERVASKIIHFHVLENILGLLERVIVRPAPLLISSVLATVGIALETYFSKHIGYSYNYFFFFVMFCAIYIFVLLADVLFRIKRH